MKNIFVYKGFRYDKRLNHIVIRKENINCKDEYEFHDIIDTWCKNNSMTKEERKKYLSSKEWKELKIKAYKQYGRQCQICDTNKKKGLTVHHIEGFTSYGCENISDLSIYCITCHKHIHWMLSRSSNKIDVPKYCNNLKKQLHKNNYW